MFGNEGNYSDSMWEPEQVKAFEDRELLQEKALDGGFEPANNKVVVFPDPLPRESAGGIVLHEESVQREEMAQIFATLVAVGPDAWKGMKAPAQVGDRVMIAKFTGQLYTGPDGRRYRVIHDLDIVGKVVKEGVRK